MSGYSVFLRAIDAPEPERLVAAFSACASLTPADAPVFARNAFGILVENLPRGEADHLHELLQAEGVETVVVDSAVGRLTEPFHLKRASTGPDGFVTFSVYDQTQTWAWENLMVVAAGRVRMEETRSRKVEGNLPTELCKKGERKYWQAAVDHVLLDLVFGFPLKRFRMDSRAFSDPVAADDPVPGSNIEFLALIKRICRHAANASRNRGVRQLLATDALEFAYPARLHFERETAWHLRHDWGEGHGC